MQPQSERGTSFVDNSEGGVRLNLMDDDTPYGHLTARSLSRAEDSDLGDIDSTAASDGTERPTFEDGPEVPATIEDVGKSKVSEGGVIEGLQALKVQSPTAVVPAKQGWAAKLFPEAKPTPVTGEWTAPATPKYRKSIMPTEFRTDWDTLALERDSVDDLYHCPFAKCP